MMNRVLHVDGNHLIYRAYFKFSGLSTLDGKATSIIYGAPYILESIIRRLGPDRVNVVFDHEHSKFRKNLLPEYKQRDSKLGDNKERFYAQRDELIKLFIALGLRVFQPKGYEADDVIGYLTQQYYKMGWESIIVTADKDFVQLIGKEVKMFNVNKGVLIDDDNCINHYEYTPRQCVDFLCLNGDKSDNIPGYPGVGPKTAQDFLSKFGSIRKFLATGTDFKRIKRDKLEEIYSLNRKLIDIMYFIRHELDPIDVEPINKDLSMDKNALIEICADNQINTFLKPQFFNTYKNLYNGK